jgi:hypothetical protein
MGMNFNWKDAVAIAAPTLGTLLGGPMAGAAVKILADKILEGGSTGNPAEDEAQVATILQSGFTPELRAKIADAEKEIKLALIAADVRKTEVAADMEKAYIADVSNARAHNANTVGILRLGYLINIASYGCVGLVLLGCYKVLTSTGMASVDPGLATAVGGIVGGAVQWLLSNAMQANGFFFGSSPGGRQNAAAGLVQSVSQAATTVVGKK